MSEKGNLMLMQGKRNEYLFLCMASPWLPGAAFGDGCFDRMRAYGMEFSAPVSPDNF